MIEYVSQGLHDAAKEAAVLLYSPVGDTFLEDLTRNADRVFYFDEGPRVTTKTYFEGLSKAQKSQTTQDVIIWPTSAFNPGLEMKTNQSSILLLSS